MEVAGIAHVHSLTRLQMAKKCIGMSLPRLEDPALLRGNGRYIDDLDAPRQLHLWIVRSPRKVVGQGWRYYAVLSLAEKVQDGSSRWRHQLGSLFDSHDP